MGIPKTKLKVEIRNPLKRRDIFRCTHTAHKNFDFSVSAYHILEVKKCYPDGCINFHWNCSALKQGQRCHRGFTTPGKDCTYCRNFTEDKNQRIPKLLVSAEEYDNFLDELREFEFYFENIKFKRIEFSGIVQYVKPLIVENGSQNGRKAEGFLMGFARGYFGTDFINDKLYAHISLSLQQRYGFRAGDRVEFYCYAALERGRIILMRLKSPIFSERGDGYIWDKSKASAAISSGKFLKSKPKKCRRCPMGILVDTESERCHGNHRRIFCLQGVENPRECVYKIYEDYIKKE